MTHKIMFFDFITTTKINNNNENNIINYHHCGNIHFFDR